MAPDDRPLCIDLFCGLGGWAEGFVAEGYRVVGFDNDPRFAAPYHKAGGEFVLADVRTLDGRRFRGARCIVGSSPCQKLTYLNFLHPPVPAHIDEAVHLFRQVERLAREADIPWVAENVAGARRYVGASVVHRGPWHLWGDVPLLFDGHLPMKVGAVARARAPDGSLKPARLRQRGARDRSANGAALRAKIPLPLARVVARGFL